MPCPACGCNDIWDDNLAWGCTRCKWFTTGAVQNKGSPYDRFIDLSTGLPERPPPPERRTNADGDEEDEGDWRPPEADEEDDYSW